MKKKRIKVVKKTIKDPYADAYKRVKYLFERRFKSLEDTLEMELLGMIDTNSKQMEKIRTELANAQPIPIYDIVRCLEGHYQNDERYLKYCERKPISQKCVE